MLEPQIKILASLYTLILMSVLTSLLLFGGFQLKSPAIKGKLIHATMVDISQLTTTKKTQPKKETTKKQEPIKEDPPKIKQQPQKQQKPPVKSAVKTPIKPQVDTKAQDIERKARQERMKKLKEIREKRKAAEIRRKIEEQKLMELAEKTKNNTNNQQIVENIGVVKGQSAADKTNQLMAQYQLAVITAVQRQWNKPASARKNLLCHVKVRQIPGGGVINATIASPCNANSIVKKSIIAAIQKADPLPYKGFEKVFDRTATFIFQPQN
jgi:colicin import membrane protein